MQADGRKRFPARKMHVLRTRYARATARATLFFTETFATESKGKCHEFLATLPFDNTKYVLNVEARVAWPNTGGRVPKGSTFNAKKTDCFFT